MEKPVVFGGLMKFGQQCIQQASIVIDTRMAPFKEPDNPSKLPCENIPTGALVFRKTRVELAGQKIAQNKRTANFVKPITSTRAQPLVFCNLKAVKEHNDISFVGVADTEITVDGDHWRYAGSNRSEIVRAAGTRSIWNSGPDHCYEGEWLFWDLPIKDPAFAQKAPSEEIHRAVVRPVNEANFERDPTCIYRTIGKCMIAAPANSMVDISISTAVAPVPPKFQLRLRDAYLEAIKEVKAKLQPPTSPRPPARANLQLYSGPDQKQNVDLDQQLPFDSTLGRGDRILGRSRRLPQYESKGNGDNDDESERAFKQPRTNSNYARGPVAPVVRQAAVRTTVHDAEAENEDDDDDMSDASEVTATTSSSTATQ